MRILSYNIQTGLGIDGRRDLVRIGELIRERGVDIAGLQEVETNSPRSGFQNQPRKLAEASGMEQAFAHGFQRGPWRFGNLSLSRFPIRSSERVPLPGRAEPRSLLVTRLGPRTERKAEGEAGGGPSEFHFLCTHLGLNQEERMAQVSAITEVMSRITGPLLLVGDFNDRPDSPPVQQILAAGLCDLSGLEPTFPAPAGTAKIDFVFGRGFTSRGAQVLSVPYSDHLPVLVEADFDP